MAVLTACSWLTYLGGCQRAWTFHHGAPTLRDVDLAATQAAKRKDDASAPKPVRVCYQQALPGEVPTVPEGAWPGPTPTASLDPNVIPAADSVVAGDFRPPEASCSASSPAPPLDPAKAPEPPCADTTDGTLSGWRGWLCEERCRLRSDYGNFYSARSLFGLTLGTGMAAIGANTQIDHNFEEWYQGEVRSSTTDSLSKIAKAFGDGRFVIPAMATLSIVGQRYADQPTLGLLGDYGDRVTRAYLVGGPPLLFLQYAIGSDRPDENSNTSHWEPFRNSAGVSGHAFVGSVPFITAAKMTDAPWAKGLLFACSTFPAWSRVNDNRHYLSQVWMGWWLGYLASQAVDHTQQENQHVTITPMISPEMTGVGVMYQR